MHDKMAICKHQQICWILDICVVIRIVKMVLVVLGCSDMYSNMLELKYMVWGFPP